VEVGQHSGGEGAVGQGEFIQQGVVEVFLNGLKDLVVRHDGPRGLSALPVEERARSEENAPEAQRHKMTLRALTLETG
jgi:hypothetical protein